MNTKNHLPLFSAKLKAIAIATIIVLSTFTLGYTFGKLSASKDVTTNATLISTVNLSVYADQSTTQQLISISWGNILPTEAKLFTIWVQNDAAISLTISTSTNSWSPNWAIGNLTLTVTQTSPIGTTWADMGAGNYPILYATKRAPLFLSLLASSNSPSGSFSFTLTVRGDSL